MNSTQFHFIQVTVQKLALHEVHPMHPFEQDLPMYLTLQWEMSYATLFENCSSKTQSNSPKMKTQKLSMQ